MYKQVLDPVGDSLLASALVAAIPIVVLFVLLGGVKMKAHWASLIALLAALLIAILVYSMPVGQALDAGFEGAAFGFFPIMYIVFVALWIYNMTVETGHFAVLRRAFNRVSDDQRVQAVIIAFSFGALLEALAGFGTPVAITAVMLIALGFEPIKAASVALVANTAPVAFGAIAVPIVTLAQVTGLPQDDLGAMVGRQTPLLALVVPLILVGMVDGGRGIRQAWPAAVVGGLTFAIGQFVCSNYISVELTDIVASLLSAGSIVALVQVWSPTRAAARRDQRPRAARDRGRRGRRRHHRGARSTARRARRRDTRGEIAAAFSPYLFIILVFALAQYGPIKDWLTNAGTEWQWPGLDVVNAKGEPPTSLTFKFGWPNAAGTLLLVAGLLTMLTLRFNPGRAIRVMGRTLYELRWATLTVATVLALAYVMNLSGQTITLGQWIAGASGILPFLSGIIGWLGVAVTGSDTSSNSLFGTLQVAAAQKAGYSPTLLAAANSSGGVLGKMISPQNLAIGAAAVGMGGQEGVLFRKVVGWSIVLVLAMCVIVYLQSTGILDWMVVGDK